MTQYLTFLLHLWRNGSAQQSGWQASLQDPLTGRRYGFATLEELFAFLLDGGTPPGRTDTETTGTVEERVAGKGQINSSRDEGGA